MKPTSPRLGDSPAKPNRAARPDPVDAPAASVRIEYPEELPIAAHRDELVDLIRTRSSLVVCGETGSGKSTQLPKFCLEAGLGAKRIIGHTQPRRLAARSIASRLADELSTRLGDVVGYKVRFGDQTSDKTRIKLMTDGVLLAETTSDRDLRRYDAIIIDEAHERSLNIDFLMGYLRQLRDRRPDLKVIITSATIDAERFAEHFADTDGPAPIVNVEGRGYPVEMRYLPWDDVAGEHERGYDLSRHVIAGLDQTQRAGQGDVLVFLPTERDIREVSHRVAGHYKRSGRANRVDLLPLYARLPQSQQQAIFSPSGGKRRVIFATNVAESSLTVPGIRYVVDTGTARMSRFSSRSRVQRLPIESVSRASADQRAGRCGRIGPGICVRLYSADDYENRDRFTTPEIRRTNLASVVLQMKTLRLGRLEDFPLLDPPRPEAIRQGIKALAELGAIDDRQELTPIGKRLGRLPVDPKIGRMLIAAEEHGVLPEMLPIAAALEIPDPRDRPVDKQQAADEAHAEFADPSSDFLSLLRLWRHYDTMREQHSRGKLIRVLRKKFLSPTRMREWADVYRQLREMMSTSGRDRVKVGKIRWIDDPKRIVAEDIDTRIHKSLLTGLLSGVAKLGNQNEYTGAGGLKLFLWPGSGVFASKPKWIMAAELVETAKAFGRTVGRIQPRWIEEVADERLKRSHADPHWSAKSGGAFCYENKTLFGLPVVVRRRVPLPPIDPATARDLLIEQGLVAGEFTTNAKFVRHNAALIDAITSLAAKTRRRDLVVDPYRVAMFYQSRVPAHVCDRGRLEKFDRELTVPRWSRRVTDASGVANWLADPPPKDTDPTPYMRPDDLIEIETAPLDAEAFPDQLEVGGSKLPLRYRFEPGGERDGINLKIHRDAMTQVSDDRLGWLVPGLLGDKVVALIKALPKRIRRNLVPAADVASAVVSELNDDFGRRPFMAAVCESLSRHAEMPVGPHDFQADKLSSHLEMLVTVVDDDGETIAEGRQLAPLVSNVGGSVGRTSTTQSNDAWARATMTTFDIETLPVRITRIRGGVEVAQFPGLRVSGGKVSTDVFADGPSADESIRVGTAALFAQVHQKELRSQVRHLPDLDASKIKLSGVVSDGDLESALIGLLARLAFVENERVIRSAAEFQLRARDRSRRIAGAAQDVASWLSRWADEYFAARRAVESTASEKFAATVGEVRWQMQWLQAPDFLSFVPWRWLQHYPRYFAAIAYRLDKLRSGSNTRDAESADVAKDLWRRWIATIPADRQTPRAQATAEFRWMIEELRVSLFAQPLGTAVKVSPARCEKLIRGG